MKIIVPHGIMKQMEKEGFGSQPTLRKALCGDFNPWNKEEKSRALKIRKRALQMGGVEIQTADNK